MSNNLINEISPYLLQHKNNPVNWYAWNNETLDFVKRSNLPTILSIGYSSCHWCHVMAHESFENIKIAEYMNENFINIKVDREERPDVDSLYQSVLALMGQQGGWPLTMFLDNDLKPFWGGTYFPNESKYGMPGFLDVLKNISKVFNDNKHQVIHNSNAIHSSLKKMFLEKNNDDYTSEDTSILKSKINNMFDPENGGLFGSPKFPMAPLLLCLLSTILKKDSINKSLLENIKKTINSICLGGIYDHLAGGFARYSTDERWLVPHFEKMLYDNAQLIETMSILFSLSPDNLLEDRISKTLDWLKSEMLFQSNGGCGYFSAIDADSGGEEGKYYVWSKEEIKFCLGKDSDEFCKNYNIYEEGNWEGQNIINRIGKGLSKDVNLELGSKNQNLLAKLRTNRRLRTLPFIDKKILTDWNSSLGCGLIRAFIAFKNPSYLDEAKKIFLFISQKHIHKNEIYHSSCEGVLGPRGTLDDYAYFIKLCFLLYEVEQKKPMLEAGKKFLEIAIKNFYDEESSDFYYSNKNNSDLFIRTKNSLDTSTRSGSSLMLENLCRAYIFFGTEKYKKINELVLKNNWSKTVSNPASHPGFLLAAHNNMSSYQIYLLFEDDLFGKKAKEYLLRLSSFFFLVLIKSGAKIDKKSPAYGKKPVGGASTVYICSGFTCSSPISSLKDLKNWFEVNSIIKNN